MFLQYADKLADDLTRNGFPYGQRDIARTGSISDLLVRTYRHNAVQVQVNEDTGQVVVAAYGIDDPDYQFGPLWEATFDPATPADAIVATIRAAFLAARLQRTDDPVSTSAFFRA